MGDRSASLEVGDILPASIFGREIDALIQQILPEWLPEAK